MAKITIDGTDYETDDMSDDLKRQVQNVAFCDRKLDDLKNEAALVQTARRAYARSLSEALSGETKEKG
ncbi:hypothetical protein JQX09_24465 [Sulfitobacter pseudonitzschiae]|uniref:Uncharacterized protein n=1 Tax=Pseudosulfitobacter pseudonitzschiae TaxID=1402135 RepID=A0A9Q2NYX1_9RHOB|nr:DUF6447 family protein [Pseudosulfitobacter pseudonitzschiae]MBM2295077.1 hypothetical protein [Pseudosulfitobacter pseudonitzschiae]MBM2299999.1 hypothetical protein [Pseudosulfitobacter pseudonitzschiae]MBM2304915.1 hypothetical protein [Pseudosulfitobacter pseudonitzschiae]MBM2314688.1 hypothetical protein [Pseudosulfitobacter pseudonitzschiae]MBM2319596.1 hypothetical protein [Pseudosulfitobacter pseudonitzschiae]